MLHELWSSQTLFYLKRKNQIGVHVKLDLIKCRHGILMTSIRIYDLDYSYK